MVEFLCMCGLLGLYISLRTVRYERYKRMPLFLELSKTIHLVSLSHHYSKRKFTTKTSRLKLLPFENIYRPLKQKEENP